jgi:PAS domain S-box-containing protein
MAFFMLICAVPIVGLAAYTYTRRDRPGGNGLLLCLVGMAGWSVQLALVTWPTQVLPLYINTTIRHFFQILVIFGWPLFAMEYVRRERVELPRAYAAGLAVIPTLTIVLTATNPLHHLVLAEATPANPVGISDFVLGPWYLVHIGFAVAMVMLPVGSLVRRFRTASGAHRKQLLLLLTGWAIGFPGALQTHLFRLIDAIPLYVDLTPISFLVTAGLWALALFRYQLFTMIPVSRRTVVETIPDPVIPVDQNGRVVDINPAGRAVFETPATVAGRAIDSLFADYPEIVDYYRSGARDAEFELVRDGHRRQFSVTCERIREGGTEAIIVLRDVTPLKRRERELQRRERELQLLKRVFSRVFRHNIRNELTVALGQLDAIEERTDDAATRERARTAIAATERLKSHAEKTREIERLVDEQPEPTAETLRVLVSDAVGSIRDVPEGVQFEIAVDDTGVRVVEGFRTALVNAVENAIEHNEPPLSIRIDSVSDAETVTLRIEDDGTGIPSNEIAFLTDEDETVLNHSSGVGLWIVQWYVQRSDGELTITNTDRGTAVEITLPRDDG